MLHRLYQLLFLAAIALSCLSIPESVQAQGKQAIVILRPAAGAGPADGCEGAQELSYQIIYDARLNAKEEVRLLNTTYSTVSREAYERSGKSKLRDLYALKWGREETLYAVSVAGQSGIMAIPENLKPQKNVTQPLSAFYGVMLSGEAREGKQKRKVDLPLRSIWKVYFTSEGAAVNDTLFNHAAEEASVALWEVYLQKTSNYRSTEANSQMRDALIVCSRADLSRFVDGDYRALDKARQKGMRAQSVKEDDATRQLLTGIRTAQQQVEDARNKAEQLIKAEKWDEAIDAADPIRKYLDSWPDLNQMYRHALEQSHEIHLNAGDKQLLANQLEAALNDCSIARSRLPASERALACVCRARTEIALRDEKKNREISRPKDAKEILEKQIADSDCRADPRLTSELKLAKCEYAAQLYTEARQLLGGGASAPAAPRRGRRPTPAAATSNVNVKLISMQNKKDFRDAREKLILATEMCPDDGINALLAATNRSISGFCVSEARKAAQRNDNGTAYVYLQKAQAYTPEDGSISELLAQVREKFQEQTRVNVGVAFANRSGNGYAEGLLNDVAAGVESASAEAGLAQANVIARDDAAASLRAIQAGRPMESPTVIFFGELLAAGARVDNNRFSVSSAYNYDNPERRRHDALIDDKSRQIDACKKQYGDAACEGLRAERTRMRAYRDSLPRYLQQAYSYVQTDFRLQGATRMSFRSTDSISRSTGLSDTLTDEVSGQCQQREGVHENDARGAVNRMCQIDDEGTYLNRMFMKIRSEAHDKALQTLRSLPFSYYRRAQTSANKQQAVESYLRFLFLSNNKFGSEAEEAKAFVITYDPELTTDGIFR